MNISDYVNKPITQFIIEKYGKFNSNTLEEFICQDFVDLKDKSSFAKVKKQIDNLLQFQNLRYEDIQYLGKGAKFHTLGIGNAVIKISNVFRPYTQVLNIPFRLNPVYQESLGETQELYVSQRAQNRLITGQEVQNFYNIIRDNGGIWTDVKHDNLGYIDNLIDFSKLYGNPKEPPFGLSFKPYNGHIFLLDYGDTIFLNSEIRELMLGDSFGCIPNYLSPKISHNILRENNNINSIYSKRFIETPHTSPIIMYEINYQKARGNYALESKYFIQIKEHQRLINESNYRYIQSQKYGRSLADIKNMYSILEIFVRLSQSACMSRLKNIASTVKKIFTKSKLENHNNSSQVSPILQDSILETLSNSTDVEL